MKSRYMRHIEAIGTSMYGRHRWQRPTARILGADRRTLGRWRDGVGGPTVEDVFRMIAASREHYSAVRQAHDAALQALQLDKPAAPARSIQTPQSAPPFAAVSGNRNRVGVFADFPPLKTSEIGWPRP